LRCDYDRSQEFLQYADGVRAHLRKSPKTDELQSQMGAHRPRKPTKLSMPDFTGSPLPGRYFSPMVSPGLWAAISLPVHFSARQRDRFQTSYRFLMYF